MATPSKMAKRHTSPYTLDIPALDLITYVFSSGSVQSRSSPQYFDADRPEVSYSLNQAESLVRRVGKGLQNLGLKTNDKVLLYSGNSVYFPVLFWGTVASGCVFTGCSPGASVTGACMQSLAMGKFLNWSDLTLNCQSCLISCRTRKPAS